MDDRLRIGNESAERLAVPSFLLAGIAAQRLRIGEPSLRCDLAPDNPLERRALHVGVWPFERMAGIAFLVSSLSRRRSDGTRIGLPPGQRAGQPENERNRPGLCNRAQGTPPGPAHPDPVSPRFGYGAFLTPPQNFG